MTEQLTVTGKIVSGEKRGESFTQLDWVQEQCRKVIKAGLFPGTLNIKIAAEKTSLVDSLLQHNGIALMPPDTGSCAGYVYPVSIMGVSGAILVRSGADRPEEANVIELIAATCLKDALDVDNGDEILFVAKYPSAS